MKKQLSFIALGVLLNSVVTTPASARPEYVGMTGAAGCTTCHANDFGGGPWKPGVVDAYLNNGGINGLIAFVKAGGATNTTPDTAPVLSQINNQWDITVGETPLVIPLHVFDQENDTFALHGSVPMTGYSISALYTDGVSNLPTQDFKWTPTAAQANKNYTISIYVQENGVGRTLKSNAVTANIFVWPARANAATAKVKEFKLQAASWAVNKLTLSGQLTFKAGVSAAKRKALLNTLTMQLRSNSGFVVGSPVKLKLDNKGAWKTVLPLTSTQVPCLVKANYEGLNASRVVNLAPASCVK